MKRSTIFILIMDIFVITCFFLFYGPFKYVRNTVISTAMITKTHQYIAHTFYNNDTINYVLQQNAYIPLTEAIDLSSIKIDTAPKAEYDNKYDEIILTRDPGNENYKLLNVDVGNYKAQLVAIYDPSKVKLITSKRFNYHGQGAEPVQKICKRLGGHVCINGGSFHDPDGWGSDIPCGYVIKDGKVIWSEHEGPGDLIGFTNDNKLMLVSATGEDAIKQGMRDALEFGPFLIVNGQQLQFNNKAGGYDRAARVAIGQRRDGVVLFLVTEGIHTKGPTLKEVTETLAKYGAYNAANLDGGSSAQLVINNKLVNNPLNVFGQKIKGGRQVVSGFGLLP